MSDKTEFVTIHPVIATEDMQRDMAFYQDKMGFKNVYDSTRYQDGAVDYAVMCRGNICIHLQLHDSSTLPADYCKPQIKIVVKNIMPLYKEYEAQGIVNNPLKDTPWETREFAFYDPGKTAITIYEDI